MLTDPGLNSNTGSPVNGQSFCILDSGFWFLVGYRLEEMVAVSLSLQHHSFSESKRMPDDCIQAFNNFTHNIILVSKLKRPTYLRRLKNNCLVLAIV